MPEFVHRTARPVTDPTTGTVTVDPQLHTHITVPTWVQRPDGSWSQLHSEPLYQHAAAAGAIAQAEWRDRLVRELGISTVVDGKGCFSIVGITDAQRREFSRRSLQIDAAAAAYDVTTRSGREVATLDTREGKHEVAATEDLFARWRERAASVGLDGETVQDGVRPRARCAGAAPSRRAALGGHPRCHGLTARQATFTRRDLIRAVASHAPLGMSRPQLEATVDGILADRDAVQPLPPRLRDGETEPEAMLRWTETGHDLRYTTPEMLALERGMVATAQARAGAGVGMARADTVAAAMATRRTLTADQRAMIQEVCLSPAGVLVIEGDAGVGKTYALEVCREAFDASGVEVVGCALAGRAAELLEEGSDIASTTVAATLHQLQVERLPYGGVLVVDEAGMLGDRQLAELVSLAARDEAKLVVVGDPFQLQPIEAGAPMRTLSDHIGRVELHENIRQQYDWERATLQLLRDGEARAAYREYERYDRIHDAHSVAERRVQVIEDHARLEAGGLDTVILARRRDEVAALNELAHARSVAEGRVHGPALTVGDKEYQVGDRVICLANERSGAVSNGTRGVVTAVDVERQTLTLERPDKRQLTLDTTHYDAIDRGYALTVHKAQGMTADIALRLVHGERVAAVDGVVVGGVEGELALVGTLQGERLALDVDRGDHAAGAVADRAAALVGETDHPVAHLVLLVTHGQRRAVDSPLGHRPGMGQLVERGHLVTTPGEDDRVETAGLEPGVVLDHLDLALGHRVGVVDAVVALVLAVRLARLTVAEQLQGCPLPVVVLADVLVQLHPADVIAQGAHRCARLDRLELEGIADHHQLGLVTGRQGDQLGELAVAEHARLVDHEHAAIGKALDLELVERGRHRRRGDVRSLLEELGGASGQGAADHLHPGGIEGFAADLERVGLADPGVALDHRTPAGLRQTSWIMAFWSAVSLRRVAIAAATVSARAIPTPAPARAWAVATMPRSRASISGVV